MWQISEIRRIIKEGKRKEKRLTERIVFDDKTENEVCENAANSNDEDTGTPFVKGRDVFLRWQSDDGLEDYRNNVIESSIGGIFDSVIEGAKNGIEIGGKIGGFFGSVGENVGEFIGAIIGGIGGFFGGLFG